MKLHTIILNAAKMHIFSKMILRYTFRQHSIICKLLIRTRAVLSIWYNLSWFVLRLLPKKRNAKQKKWRSTYCTFSIIIINLKIRAYLWTIFQCCHTLKCPALADVRNRHDSLPASRTSKNRVVCPEEGRNSRTFTCVTHCLQAGMSIIVLSYTGREQIVPRNCVTSRCAFQIFTWRTQE